mgnify:CR=1 FL=1
MGSRQNTSPDEHASLERHPPVGGSRGIALAAVALFLLALFCPITYATPSPPGNAPEAGKAAPVVKKAKPQPAAPAKAAAASQKPATGKNKAGHTANAKKKKPSSPVVSPKTKAKAEALAAELSPELPTSLEQEISKFFGLRYRLGGEGKDGIDCSALVKRIYEDAFGIRIPRNSIQLSRYDALQPVSPEELKPGDLVFFGPNRKRVNHVGLYLAGGRFLHAVRSEGVTISSLDSHYWKSRFMFSRRMRGLDLEEEREDQQALAFERELKKDAFLAGLGRDEVDVRFLEGGIEINDTLELLLSGFFLNALDAKDLLPESVSAAVSLPEESLQEGEPGFRVGASISLLEWLKIIPSIFQSETLRDEKNSRQQRIGLETWMVLPESRVAVFLAAHARNQEDLLQRPLDVNPDLQTADVSLGLHYHFSDALRFSLWGSHAYRPEADEAVDGGRRSPTALDELSVQFRLQF